MKPVLLRCLLYALAGLALVVGYFELRSFGQAQVTLRDDTGPMGGAGFVATPCGLISESGTTIRNGHVVSYEISFKTVVQNGMLGVAVNYHGTRDGKVSEFHGVLPFTQAQSDSQLWTHLDDHLLASASLQ